MKKNETCNKVFDCTYTQILIAKKIFGMWFEFWSVNRFSDDPLKFFHQTRDHYKRIWGAKNVRFRLYYPDQFYTFG